MKRGAIQRAAKSAHRRVAATKPSRADGRGECPHRIAHGLRLSFASHFDPASYEEIFWRWRD
jgi:hypothetical protein